MSAAAQPVDDGAEAADRLRRLLISDYNALDQIPTQPAPPDARTQQTQDLGQCRHGHDHGAGPARVQEHTNALFSLGTSGGIAHPRIDMPSRASSGRSSSSAIRPPLTDRQLRHRRSAANRAIARRAAAESQVLLRNDGVLPLAKTATVYLAGSNADNLAGRSEADRLLAGNSGNTGTDIPTGGTNRTAIENVVAPGTSRSARPRCGARDRLADVGRVVGERRNAEGNGDQARAAMRLSIDRCRLDRDRQRLRRDAVRSCSSSPGGR